MGTDARAVRPGRATNLPVRRERSAGGVTLVRFGTEDYVALIVLRGGAVLALPKGHIEPGETAEEASRREVHEETGLRTRTVAPLGWIEYWFVAPDARVRKRVDFFLLRYVSGAPRPQDSEVDGVRLVARDSAARQLTYPGERTVIRRAEQLWTGE